MSHSTDRRCRLTITAILFLAVSSLCASAAIATYEVGDTIDDFTLNDLNGQPVSLSDFAGDIVVINFFATWCPGCNVEAAELENNIHLAYQEYNVTVLAIDILETPQVVQNWADSQGVTYQIVLAPNWDLFASFPRAGGIPYNAVIDDEGVLRYANLGFNEEAIILTLDTLLELITVADEKSSFGELKALFR